MSPPSKTKPTFLEAEAEVNSDALAVGPTRRGRQLTPEARASARPAQTLSSNCAPGTHSEQRPSSLWDRVVAAADAFALGYGYRALLARTRLVNIDGGQIVVVLVGEELPAIRAECLAILLNRAMAQVGLGCYRVRLVTGSHE